MQKNVAGQKWQVFAFNRTTNQPVTGDAANITADIRIDGGAANPVDDVNPTELSGGYYIFDITQTESNGDLLSIIPVSATADVQVIGCPAAQPTVPPGFNSSVTQTGDSFARLGAPAGASLAADLAQIYGKVDTEIGDIVTAVTTTIINHILSMKGATFDELTDSLEAIRNRGDAAWGGGGGASDWTTLEKEQIRNRLGIDGTESVPVSNTPNLGNMELSPAAVDAILDDVVEGGLTLRQTTRIMLSALAGKVSGGGTAEIIFKGVDGMTARITATVDANGNRTAVVINGN